MVVALAAEATSCCWPATVAAEVERTDLLAFALVAEATLCCWPATVAAEVGKADLLAFAAAAAAERTDLVVESDARALELLVGQQKKLAVLEDETLELLVA